MEYARVFKRACRVVRSYRALWVFGLILALTTASFGSVVFYRNRDRVDIPDSFIEVRLPSGSVIRVPGMIRIRGDSDGGRMVFNYGQSSVRQPNRSGDIVVTIAPPDELSVGVVARDPYGRLELKKLASRPEVVRSIVALASLLAGIAACVFLASRVARYMAETALLRMVDEYEETGKQYTLQQGLRLGWSRTAWRILLINWVINLAIAAVILVPLSLLILPLGLLRSATTLATVIAALSVAGLLLLTVALMVVASSALSLLKQFAWRACALEGLGVAACIRQGIAMIRKHSKDAALVWLAMLGVDLAWPVLVAPIVFVLLALSVIIGGLSTLLAGAMAGLFLQGVARWAVAGGLVGVPVFFLVLFGPVGFLGGLRELFQSSAWTLTYRELRALEASRQRLLPELAPSGAR